MFGGEWVGRNIESCSLHIQRYKEYPVYLRTYSSLFFTEQSDTVTYVSYKRHLTRSYKKVQENLNLPSPRNSSSTTNLCQKVSSIENGD